MIGICRNCGANLEPGATKCRRCGAEVTEEPVKEPVRKNKTLRPRLSWPWLMEARRKWLFLAAAAIGLLLLALVLTAVVLSFKNKDAQPESPPPAATAAPTAPVEAVETSQPSPEPQVSWAEIYRNFLETDPTVNTRMVANAEEYGFEGTMTAELFALADVNDDAVPELLLATRPETLPGWNLGGEQGLAVERYIVCAISEERVSPLMCGKVDFSFFPLALTINDQWILEQGRTEDTGLWMQFRSPEGQSSCRTLRYTFTVEPRINSAGDCCDMPVDRWFIDEERVLADKALEELFPQGAETLNYFPIFFQKLSPGCLDTLESDWENRQVWQLSRTELYKLRAAAGSDWISEGESTLAYIDEPYCISLTSDGETWVMILGVDKAAGWDYVQSVQVEAVGVADGDAWVHDSTTADLEEEQVLQYVVGISTTEEEQPVLRSRIRLTLHDGTEITKEYVTQAS